MITHHENIEQGTPEWLELRCGILTASEFNKILTPTLKTADNDETRSHVYEILAQRINKYVEPMYITDDMLRGHTEEIYAREKYSEKYGEVTEIGFITNDKLGFNIGYSPDGLVGDDGLIEIKSRKQKYQLETILSRGLPKNNKINPMMQIQVGLFVSERKWCDFISYHGGMPMWVYRVEPDEKYQEAIKIAAESFEEKVKTLYNEYMEILKSPDSRVFETERIIIEEIEV